MQIHIPASLTAEVEQWDFDQSTREYKHQKVSVCFGRFEVVSLDPVEPFSRWNDDDDNEAIAQRTVANWLREKLA